MRFFKTTFKQIFDVSKIALGVGVGTYVANKMSKSQPKTEVNNYYIENQVSSGGGINVGALHGAMREILVEMYKKGLQLWQFTFFDNKFYSLGLKGITNILFHFGVKAGVDKTLLDHRIYEILGKAAKKSDLELFGYSIHLSLLNSINLDIFFMNSIDMFLIFLEEEIKFPQEEKEAFLFRIRKKINKHCDKLGTMLSKRIDSEIDKYCESINGEQFDRKFEMFLETKKH